MSTTPALLTWIVETDILRLSVEPIFGTTPAIVAVTIDTSGLAYGSHEGRVTFQSSNARVIPVHVAIRSQHAVYLPIVLR